MAKAMPSYKVRKAPIALIFFCLVFFILTETDHEFWAIITLFIIISQLSYYFVTGLFNALRKSGSVVKYCAMAIIIGIALTGFSMEMSRTHAKYVATIYLWPHYAENCIAKARKFDMDKRFSICEIHEDTCAYGLIPPYCGEDIVYDSSDQIALPESQRSPGWNEVTREVKLRPDNYKAYGAHLTGHFYFVDILN